MARIPTGDSGVLGVAFAPSGRILATAHHVPALRLWSLPERPLGSLGGHEGAVRALAFSADGRLLAADHDGIANLWDVRRGQPRTEVVADKPLRAAAVSSDGALEAVAGDGIGIELRELRGGPRRHLPAAA